MIVKGLIVSVLLSAASAANLRKGLHRARVGSCSEGKKISPEDSPSEGTITDNPVQSEEYLNSHKCS